MGSAESMALSIRIRRASSFRWSGRRRGEFVYLVEQFRYTVMGKFMEFPQGGWETADVVPEEMARGELKEETGLETGRLTHLAMLQIAYGVLNQKHHVFLAEELVAGEAEPDFEETDLVVHRVRVEQFERMLLDGTIVDNCTAAAWGVYLVWKRQHRDG